MAAAMDMKQTVLSPMFTLIAKLPGVLAAAPSKPKAPGYQPHPLGRLRLEADNVIVLEVNACVHRLIDVILLDHEKQTMVIEMECRTMLNTLIDKVVLDAKSNPFFHLKAGRHRYTQATKRKVVDLVQAASSSQGISRPGGRQSSSCKKFQATRRWATTLSTAGTSRGQRKSEVAN